ncbi:MAG TPA: hypothetical protein VHQ22_03335 [Terriglobales bacterium]|nr:hypothetical protein [Terriglobales bacterium]
MALISAWRTNVQLTAPLLELQVGKLATIKLNGVAGISVLNLYDTSTRLSAKPGDVLHSGSGSGDGKVPPELWQLEIGGEVVLLPKFGEQTRTCKVPELREPNSADIRELTVVAVDPVTAGSDAFDGVEEPSIAYSIPVRVAEVRFKVTRKK